MSVTVPRFDDATRDGRRQNADDRDIATARGSDMPLWATEYAVVDPKTKRTQIRRSTILAPSRQEVVLEYDKIGATAISVKKAGLLSRVWSVLRPPNARALIQFFRAYHSLYTLVPNDQIVSIAAEECEDRRLKAVLEEMTVEVIDGVTISAVCARRPRDFSATLVALLRAGERGARNAEILTQLTRMLASRAQFRQEVIATASYPVFILLCLIAFVLIMGSWVAPKIEGATSVASGGLGGDQSGGALGVIAGIAAFIVSPFGLVLGIFGIAALIVGAIVYYQTPRGRARLGAWSLRIPLVGHILAKIAEAQFARTYGTLASALLPAEAFRLSIAAAGHPSYVEALYAVYPDVRDGHKASTLLKATRLFSRRFTSVLFIGEKSATIGRQMLTFADETEREVTTLLQALGKPMQGIFYAMAGVATLLVALPILNGLVGYMHAILPAGQPAVPSPR